MKIFFWLLLAVNVVLFAVMKFFDHGAAVEALQPMHPEKIAIVSASAPIVVQPLSAQPASAVPSLPASNIPVSGVAASGVSASAVSAMPALAVQAASAPVEARSLACYEWGEFSGAELDQVSVGLKKLQLGDKLSQREIDHNVGFWVYLPPLKDKAAVSQKIEQLKSRGITDYFVVQDQGEWFNAISLGVFKSREAAQNFLAGLRAKNVHSAKLGERASKNRAIVFAIRDLDQKASAALLALQKNYSENELKRVSCH